MELILPRAKDDVGFITSDPNLEQERCENRKSQQQNWHQSLVRLRSGSAKIKQKESDLK